MKDAAPIILDDFGDVEGWRKMLAEAAADAATVHVRFPSHLPEEFEARTGAFGLFSELVSALSGASDGGARVLLVHTLDPATLAGLPDLVRFVDDHLPDAEGICFRYGEEMADVRAEVVLPWWRGATNSCGAREVGFVLEPPDALPSDGAGLKSARVVDVDVDPEPVSVLHLGDPAPSMDEAIETLMNPVGGFPRFVNPSRIDLPDDVLDAFCQAEARDHDRVHRLGRPTPWVLLNLGAADLSGDREQPFARPALVEALIRRCLTLRTVPHVACAWTGSLSGRGQAALGALSEVCRASDVPFLAMDLQDAERTDVLEEVAWTLASAEADRGAGALACDYVVSVGRVQSGPFSAATAAGFGLLPPDVRAGVLDGLKAAWPGRSEGAATRPVSEWLHTFVRQSLAAQGAAAVVGHVASEHGHAGSSRLPAWVQVAREQGLAVDLGRASATDLWILDAPDLELLLAGSDPLPLDRFLLDALGREPNTDEVLGAAEAAGIPYARLEGGRIFGSVPDGVMTGPPRVPTRPKARPLRILGIASTTLMNHAAVLVEDGQVVAAVQEERLRRRKQIGWHPPGRPTDTVVSDSALPLERAYPQRAIQCVLDMAGIGLDDVDCIALNGVPARFFPTYSLTDPSRPPRTVRFGRHIFVPHHLAHAASAYRVSGLEDAWVFTVDGRGERETAGFFEPDAGALRRVFDIRCHEDSLIGGVYEYITTLLGFGHHGAGSTMGLAPLGEPTMDLSRFLSARGRDDYAIHDRGIGEVFGHLARQRGGPLEPAHMELAASVQRALEETVLALIADGLAGRDARQLCLAGGVALNCSLNQRIRTTFGVEQIFVQPAANDAGTALGAALEAHWEITGEAMATPMRHAALGPGYDDARLRIALDGFGVPYDQPSDLAKETAQRIASGQVVCWFQGRLEFGPRALGSRSILADPRSADRKDHVNHLKRRQWWRPFGPSILAGHEQDWFETPFESPFMLFTLPVRPERQDDIAAVMHVDGTTRPQSVTAEDLPDYHAVIEHFHTLTGVPMVLNTSFNTCHEPIVCTPEDAIQSFLQLGADAMAMGPYLVDRKSIPSP